MVALIVGLSALALVICFIMLTNTGDRFKYIINASAPTITAALKLGQAAEAADANAADYQLVSRVTVTSPDYDINSLDQPALQASAWDNFLKQRQQISDLLFQARSNINYPGEADVINLLSTRFLDYVAQVNLMRYELDQGRKEAALAAYKSAHDILVGNLGNVIQDEKGRSPEEILKLNGWGELKANGDCLVTSQYSGIEANIQKLAVINRCQLEKVRNETRDAVDRNIQGGGLVCLALVAALVILCFRSAIITHRVINPGYFLALIGAVAITIPVILSFVQAKKDYQAIAEDNFQNIQASDQFRQYAAGAHADESRLLLSPEGSGWDSANPALTVEVRRAFKVDTLVEDFNKKKALMNQELDKAWKKLNYREETAYLCQVSPKPNTAGTTGNCSNTSFALVNYLEIDRQIREAFKNNLLAKAIQLETGPSTTSFNSFDKAMAQVSQLNETGFSKTACSAIGQTSLGQPCNEFGYVPLLRIGIWIIFPLIALATLGGFALVRNEF